MRITDIPAQSEDVVYLDTTGKEGGTLPQYLVLWAAEICRERPSPQMRFMRYWGNEGALFSFRGLPGADKQDKTAVERLLQKLRVIGETPLIRSYQIFMDRAAGGTVWLFIHFPTPVILAAAAYDFFSSQMRRQTPEYLEFRCSRDCPCPNNTAPAPLCPGSGKPCRFTRSYMDCGGWIYRLWYNGGYGWRAVRMNPGSPLVKQEFGILSPRDTFDQAQSDLNRYARLMDWEEYREETA